ncbi:hypothetical protein SOVF_032230, partial [Spinacia oleracea]
MVLHAPFSRLSGR